MYNLIEFCASMHLPTVLFIALKGLRMVPGEVQGSMLLADYTRWLQMAVLKQRYYFCQNIYDDHRRDMSRLWQQDVPFMVHNSAPHHIQNWVIMMCGQRRRESIDILPFSSNLSYFLNQLKCMKYLFLLDQVEILKIDILITVNM